MKKLALLFVVFLAGCQSDGREKTIAWLQTQGMDEGSAILLADNKPALRRYIMNRSMAGQDDSYCRSLGATPGTDAYVNCRVSVSTNRPVSRPRPRTPSVTVVNRPQQEAPSVAPRPSQQPQTVYQPAPGSALMGAGRSAYCTRMPQDC